MRSVMLAALAGGAAAVQYPLGNNVCVTDCCSTGKNKCAMEPRQYCFDQVSQPGFDFVVSGPLSSSVSAPTYEASGKLLGVKMAETPETGSVCQPAQIQIENGAIGSIAVDFTNRGAQSCPFPAGKTVTVPGTVSVTINPPMGKFLQHFETRTETGELIMCLDVTVGSCTPGPKPAGCGQPSPPAPPAPVPPTPPAGQQYKCSDAQQCVTAAAGVDIATCQAICKPVPTPPSPPAEQKYKCDATQACVAATAGGMPLATCQAACSPAPAPPAPQPPAPAPPAPTPPAPTTGYKCDSATGQCSAAAGGISLGDCQTLCPKPVALYQCVGKQCVKADTGISSDLCQQACT